MALDRRNGAAHPDIVRRQESDQWDQQQARIEFLRSVALHEAVPFGVEAVPAYVVVDAPTQRSPSSNRPREAELFAAADRAVDGDPGHDLGIREMPRRPAHLP